mgnify:CR=1 FL=1
MTEPKESASQGLRGVVDPGSESFAVDGISEIAEIETKEDKTPAKEEKPAGEKEAAAPVSEEGGEKEADEKKAWEVKEDEEGEKKKTEEEPKEKPPAESSDEDIPAGVRKRLATMTRKRRDAERTTATLQAANQDLLTRIEALEHPESKPGEEPQIDEYETEEEYLEACVEYKADQKIAERDTAAQIEQEEKDREGPEAAAEERQAAFKTELEKGIKKFNDFEEVIEDLNITGDMIQILETLPNIPEMVYALGNDSDKVAKLVDMPFLQAAYVMKEISDELTKQKSTKAPAPIKPVSTSGGAIKSLESMSQAEYNKYRDKQDAERRGMH